MPSTQIEIVNDVPINALLQPTPNPQHRDGFTLIELIIVVAIIGVMISVAIPTIQAFIDRSRIASALGASRMIQEALAAHSMTDDYDSYPQRVADYSELVELTNQHGASLKETEVEMGFEFRSYTGIDFDGDGTYEKYTMSIKVSSVPTSRPGWCVTIQPTGVARCHAK